MEKNYSVYIFSCQYIKVKRDVGFEFNIMIYTAEWL